jgi:hypothetical protein
LKTYDETGWRGYGNVHAKMQVYFNLGLDTLSFCELSDAGSLDVDNASPLWSINEELASKVRSLAVIGEDWVDYVRDGSCKSFVALEKLVDENSASLITQNVKAPKLRLSDSDNNEMKSRFQVDFTSVNFVDLRDDEYAIGKMQIGKHMLESDPQYSGQTNLRSLEFIFADLSEIE